MNTSSPSNTSLLLKEDITKMIESEELHISPLLEKSQIGEISIDFRIGTDFLTSQQGREPYIDASSNDFDKRPIRSFFTETRRRVGEPFLFHPNQVILFSTLEYTRLPANVFGVLSTRSSYSRLGMTVSTIVQPGYCGCVSVEVIYSGNTPVKVLCGTRFVQMRLYLIERATDYFSFSRKYVCQVRPIASKANEDIELIKLAKLADL
jgi:dCTP deaminase